MGLLDLARTAAQRAGSTGGGTGYAADMDWGGYLQANPDVQQHWDSNTNNVQSQFGSPDAWARQHYGEYGQTEGRSFGAPAGGGGWWDSNPYAAGAQGSTPVGSPQAQVETGGGQYPLSSVSGEGFMKPWTTAFNAPSQDEMRNDDQYQFALGEGMNQIQRGAAAKGNLLTGGTLKDLTSWSQGLASQQFDKIYGRKQGEYKDAYNIFKQNQNDQWNRLSSLANLGQTSSQQLNQQAGQYGRDAAGNIIGAGDARATATAGSGSAWGGTIGTIGNIAGGVWAGRQPSGTNIYDNSFEFAPSRVPTTPNAPYW